MILSKCTSCNKVLELKDITLRPINYLDLFAVINMYAQNSISPSSTTTYIMGKDIITKTPTGKKRKHYGKEIFEFNIKTKQIYDKRIINFCKFKDSTLRVDNVIDKDLIKNVVKEFKEKEAWNLIK